MVNTPKPIVAIFGGSFDPPHLGHQKIVSLILESLSIDKLLIVPTYLNPFKTETFADASQRLAWCHTIFDTLPKVSVEAYEVAQGKSITTEQTVKHFNTLYSVKYLVIGSDNLESLTKWHHFEWLNSTITWVIIHRKGYDMKTSALHNWLSLTLDVPISSTQIRQEKNLDTVDIKIKHSVKSLLEGFKP